MCCWDELRSVGAHAAALGTPAGTAICRAGKNFLPMRLGRCDRDRDGAAPATQGPTVTAAGATRVEDGDVDGTRSAGVRNWSSMSTSAGAGPAVGLEGEEKLSAPARQAEGDADVSLVWFHAS
jgi:hypothetical protein